MPVLVIDVGTSGVRSVVVGADGRISHEAYREVLPASPAPGLVEFDPVEMAGAALGLAHQVLSDAGTVDAVGIANQRASTIVWDRATGEPTAPGQGWQDLRTVGACLELQAEGIRLVPNQSATKLANILDEVDPDRTRDLCFGTVDSWIVWNLTEGRSHVTDLSNGGVTGLLSADGTTRNHNVLDVLNIPESVLPTVVDSSGDVARATALDGAPPICGIAGDQQSSLIGQGCVHPGLAKITFGTGGMLDLCVGEQRPAFDQRGPNGTFVIACWRRAGHTVWGMEAMILSAGTNVEWLRDDLGVISTASESHDVAAQCKDTDGVVFVPALLGLGTPQWDYGARGTLLGVTRGTDAPHVVRAVLEGVAQRGADLVEAAEADAGVRMESLRIDGGMSANPTFVQALADATQRPIEVSSVREATTLGAAFLAGLSIGIWGSWEEVAATWRPESVVEPTRELDRAAWKEAVRRAAGWHEDLSALEF